MRLVGYITDRHIMVVGKTGVEIIFQFVSILRISTLFSVPGFYHVSIQFATPTTARSLIVNTVCSLTVAFLHFQCFSYCAPCEVPAITNTESFFFWTFFGCYQDDTITGTWTVESGSIRTFQYRNGFDVIGINVDRGTATVYTAIVRSVRTVVVAERHTIDNP